MRKMMILTIAALFPLACLLAGPAWAQQMYKWTDENGVVHFSETPPEGQEAQASDIPKGAQPMGQADMSAPVSDDMHSAAQQRREELARKRDEAQAEAAIRDAECAAKRAEVARLEPNRRVFYEDASGETVRMDDQVRVDRVAEAKKFIQENCN
jgi:hypothetical protein